MEVEIEQWGWAKDKVNHKLQPLQNFAVLLVKTLELALMASSVLDLHIVHIF